MGDLSASASVYAVPAEARRGHPISLEQIHRQLQAAYRCWKLNLDPLEEHPGLLTAGLSLQLQPSLSLNTSAVVV